jgi:hypothetical protein
MAANTLMSSTYQTPNLLGPDKTAIPSRPAADSKPHVHNEDLWAKAKEVLSPEDQELVYLDGNSNIDILDEVLKIANDKKQECIKKQWTITRKGKKIFLRDIFDKILQWVTKFQEAGDFLASMDVSGHAALPWSIVKFIIEVWLPCRFTGYKDGCMLTVVQAAGKDSKKHGAVLEGMEFAAREISYYSIFEGTYLSQSTKITDQVSKITDLLSAELIRTYSKILELLVKAKRYFDHNTFSAEPRLSRLYCIG